MTGLEAPAGPRNGAFQILLATAIGGGAGYVLTAFAGVRLGADGYTPFAVFWSALYLLISAASGVQQEVTRATSPLTVPNDARGAGARNFALVSAALVLVLISASALLWATPIFGADGWPLVAPLAVGIAGYVCVAVMAGVIYGMQLWRFAAALVIIDGVARLILVGGTLLVTEDMAVVAWAVAAPFVLAPIVVWQFARRSLVGRYQLDVDARQLSWNVARTVVGAAATGVLISGFPLLLGATSAAESPADVAAIVFASNLTRAPIVIVVLALQSYLIVRFRSHGSKAVRDLVVVVSIVVISAALLALIALLCGEWVFSTFFGPEFVLEPSVLALLVGSAGAVGTLCATGPFVLARGRHALFTAGWVVAAAATIAPLLMPMEFTTRALLALWIGPLLGLAIHLGGLAVTRWLGRV